MMGLYIQILYVGFNLGIKSLESASTDIMSTEIEKDEKNLFDFFVRQKVGCS